MRLAYPSLLASTLVACAALSLGAPSENADTLRAQALSPSCAPTEVSNRAFGKVIDVSVNLTSAVSSVSKVVPAEGFTPSAMRLLISNGSETASDWVLEIRDTRLRLLELVHGDEIAASERGVWTGRLDTEQISVFLLDAGPTDKVVIEKAVIYDGETSGELFSIFAETPRWQSLHGDEKDPPYNNLQAARLGDSVGMLTASGLNSLFQLEAWCCSGVMISPTLFLTNWHCGGNKGFSRNRFWDPNVVDSIILDLGWDGGGRNRQYQAQAIVYQNEQLDTAVLRVAPTSGATGDDLGAVGVQIGADPPSDKGGFMIHHPNCAPKMITQNGCKTGSVGVPGWTVEGGETLMDTDFYHTCDTETGSSGAPFFDSEGNLVGLHHLGKSDAPSCGNETIQSNRAIRVEAILQDLRDQESAIYNELTFSVEPED